MTFKTWAALAAACIAVYWLPVVIGPGEGVVFFVANSSWSLVLCTSVLMLSTSRTALGIAVLESAAILLNLVCLWQYVAGSTGLLYASYGALIDCLMWAEFFLLLTGAPWRGVGRSFHKRRLRRLGAGATAVFSRVDS